MDSTRKWDLTISIKFSDSESILPHAGVGGCTPIPRKLSAASTIIAVPTFIVAKTIIGAIALGKICFVIILVLLAPSALAASIYSLFFIDNMEPLNILAK